MKNEPGIASCHERSVFEESFHRYSKWHGLPIDDAGFVRLKCSEIDQDLQEHRFSFEASAPISLSIEALYAAFDAKFVFMVRSPEKVVNSYISKFWYEETYDWDDQSKAPGYSPQKFHRHHFFGRMLPKENYEKWCEMGQVGRLSWFWNILNLEVLKLLENLPEESYRVYRLEDFNYRKYQEVTEFFGFETKWSEAEYQAKVASKPNTRRNIPSVADWSDRDLEDFERETARGREVFNYEVDIRALRRDAAPSVKQKLPAHRSFGKRVVRAVRAAKKAFSADAE